MPVVQYTWQHQEGHEIIEEGMFEHTSDVKATLLAQEPVFSHGGTLISFKVTDPFSHLHTWIATNKVWASNRSNYYCKHCKITAWRRLTVLGESGGMQRDEIYKNEKNHAVCKDPLRKLGPLKFK